MNRIHASSASKLAEEVKFNLTTVETTTFQTLSLLRALLCPDLDTSARKSDDSQTECTRQKKVVATKTTGAPKRPTKRKPALNVQETTASVTPKLQLKDRRKLATEVINTSLKTLSNAAKAKQGDALAVQASPQNIPRKNTHPLKDRSPNRSAKPARTPSPLPDLRAIRVVADCASAALDCLRESKTGSEEDSPFNLSTANAALVLIDKCITLHLQTKAEAQLRKLHGQYWKRRKVKYEASKHLEAGQRLCHCLYALEEQDSKLFKFATSLQSQCLRLLILGGPKCVDANLTTALQPETTGSPAWVILHGYQSGYLDAEACALQLRTISAAVSKLCSFIAEEVTAASPSPLQTRCLFFVAAQIKCCSWKYLGNEPDLQKELWSPLARNLKRYVNQVKTSKEQQPMQCLHRLRECLVELQLDSKVPVEFEELFGGPPLARQQGLGEQLCNLRLQNSNMNLLQNMKLAVEAMTATSAEYNHISETLDQLIERLACQDAIKQSDLVDLLLEGAHVRKHTLAVIARIEVSANASATKIEQEVASRAARLVYALLDFSMRVMQVSTSKDHAKDRSPLPTCNMVLTLAKTAEAVVSLDQYSFTRSEALLGDSRRALVRCVELSRAMSTMEGESQQPSASLFLGGLPARVSQIFWSRYRWLTEHRRKASDRLQALDDSIQILKELPIREQHANAITVKFEEMASLFRERGQTLEAMQSIKLAIDARIEQGTLADALQIALSSASDQAWDDSTSSIYSFSQNLSEYCKLGISSNANENWLYDREDLPLIHRSLLVERQVISALSRVPIKLASGQIRASVETTLRYASLSIYKNHRLRFISKILKLLERAKFSSVKDIFTDQQVLVECAESSDGKLLLQSLSPFLNITTSAQWAFASGTMNEVLMVTLVGGFGTALSTVQDEKQFPSLFHDMKICVAQLKALADFAGVLGRTDTQLRALECLSKLQYSVGSGDSARHATCLSQLALLQSQAGETIEAGKTFAQAEKILAANSVEALVKASVQLDKAEHLLNTSNFKLSSTILGSAYVEFAASAPAATSSKAKFARQSCLSRGALITSKLAFHQGDFHNAYLNARKGVKISTALWLAIEKTFADSNRNENHDEESALQLVVNDFSNLSLSGQHEPLQSARGTMYWAQICLHRATLQHLASMAAHAGLYQDALFYYRQAETITRQTATTSHVILVQSELCLLHAAAGNAKAASSLLPSLMSSVPVELVCLKDCAIALNLSEALWLLDDKGHAQDFLNRINVFQPRQQQSPRTQEPLLPPKITPRKKENARPVPARLPKKLVKTQSPSLDESPPKSPKLNILTLSQWNTASRAQSMEDRLVQREPTTQDLRRFELKLHPMALVTRALLYLHQSMKLFSADPASNTLAETALAFPVRYRSTRRSGQLSLLLHEAPQSPARSENGDAFINIDPIKSAGHKLLVEAYFMLKKLGQPSLSMLPSSMVHTMYKVLSQLNLLSTALAQPLIYSPVPVVLQNLIPKDIARSRERAAIAAEINSDYSSKPQLSEDTLGDLINLLPISWNVISIGLSHDGNELLLSRINAGVSPFLMRIPLTRPGIEDMEAHEFTLDFAKHELIDVIKCADANTHDPRGQGDKQTRKVWFAEREALDERLECLLRNMENIWLGGFKGLLSSRRVNSDVLSRFGQSLTQALNNHLPSRKKASRMVEKRIELHARILELFVTIKFEDTAEFEDAITDLLYFVVDVLQFNGEPNACDEIDFDSLLVDVLDALRGYHNAEANLDTQQQQTILILDKELHAFPWESLPCLCRQAVYRMPSLGAVRERVEVLRTQSAEAQSISILARSGAYILNPSSDLSSTQETFAMAFDKQLSHFDSIINRLPTESEFKSCIEGHSVFLYFGHGSGSQYIRGREIRKMQECAVTFLMGCSSLKMTECGIYEPYGMPWHYINGGSPAVVGTLWDVTDRDIDRFAMKALCEWGLLKEDKDTEKVFRKAKSKGMGKTKTVFVSRAENETGVSIGEAVATSREVCVLKYLNGAAPVVYGVPVVLK